MRKSNSSISSRLGVMSYSSLLLDRYTRSKRNLYGDQITIQERKDVFFVSRNESIFNWNQHQQDVIGYMQLFIYVLPPSTQHTYFSYFAQQYFQKCLSRDSLDVRNNMKFSIYHTPAKTQYSLRCTKRSLIFRALAGNREDEGGLRLETG